MSAFSPLQLAAVGGGVLRKIGRKAVTLVDESRKQQKGIAGADATFDAVTFDAVVTVNHRRRATVTRNPVEEGADITDHTKAEPREIELSEAIVSNLPVTLSAPFVRLPGAGLAAWGQLEKWRTAGTVLMLACADEVYDKVVIEDLSKPDDARRAGGMHATIKLVEIRTVAVRTEKVPAKKDRATGEVNQGAQAKKPADAAVVDNDSALFNLGQALGVLPK